MREEKISRARGEGGFTLLEVLIALSLMAIIMASLYGTFFASSEAIKTTEERLVALKEARSAVAMLRRELESAHEDGDLEESELLLYDRDYYGRPASLLSFTTHMAGVAGPVRLTYHVEPPENRKGETLEGPPRLLKDLEPQLGEGDSQRFVDIEMLEEVEVFRVEARGGINEKWRASWDSAHSGGMPTELRIRVKVVNGPAYVERVRPMIGKKLL